MQTTSSERTILFVVSMHTRGRPVSGTLSGGSVTSGSWAQKVGAPVLSAWGATPAPKTNTALASVLAGRPNTILGP